MWTVRAHDLATGTARWTRTDAPGIALHATSAGVVVGTGFAASDIEVAEPTGTAVLTAASGATAWLSEGTAPLTVSADSILVSTGTDPGGIAALDPVTSTPRWTHTDPEHAIVAEASATHRAVVTVRDTATGTALAARVLDTATGAQVGPDLALPVNADVTVRVDRDTDVALVGDGSALRGIDLATGAVLWTRVSGPDPVSVAGGGRTWLPASSTVLISRTGQVVTGVPVEGVTAAGPTLALTHTDADLHGTTLPVLPQP
jgi:hypothetical protein